MKTFVVTCLLLLIAMPAFAATSKDVSYKSGDDAVHGLIYTPAGKGPFPAIIVILSNE